jgi:starch synthase (maltosyl-transferring)
MAKTVKKKTAVTKTATRRARTAPPSPTPTHEEASAPENRTPTLLDVRRRAIIENVQPQVDGGRFPIKRAVGEAVIVEADVFTDGHDVPRARLRHRRAGESEWIEEEMQPLVNDRWRARFVVDQLGRYEYTIVAWTDRFATWRREFERRNEPADILIAMQVAAGLLESAAERAQGEDASALRELASRWQAIQDAEEARRAGLDLEAAALIARYPDRQFETVFDAVLSVVVDPVLARFGAWYEFFPRSVGPNAETHGTFRDCEAMLPYIEEMGFDIVYLPPIHPIGRERRKGPNNTLTPSAHDPGSPWAIGAKEGGHRELHRQLGTLEDFKRLIARARERRLEIAMDIAFQCAPDHPYVKAHPEWFRFRPDGSVQYAENPPKKYQDIYPFDFETEAWQSLSEELTGVVLYWAEQGVRVFRVDNPHTKPFPFWETLIAEVKRQYPEAIFLSEAFTRPKVMHRLAKLGFTQSYTYFTWRNTQHELREYFTELSLSPSREYFRPNVWPNTPDILPEYLQVGGRAAFMTRIVLAATLSANYGIYGPAFELMEHAPREPGSEEYRDSEKYQIRRWDLNRPDSLAPFIKRLNEIRRAHKALQRNHSLRWLNIDNEQMIAFAKVLDGDHDAIVVVANLDPYHVHSGWLDMPLEDLGIDPRHAYRMDDLVGGGSFLWEGRRNFVKLDPQGVVAHVFLVRRHVRSEQEFDYFM